MLFTCYSLAFQEITFGVLRTASMGPENGVETALEHQIDDFPGIEGMAGSRRGNAASYPCLLACSLTVIELQLSGPTMNVLVYGPHVR